MSSSTSSLSSTFRSKALQMKSWKPENPPSNRDRLELYALHKQAVSGDAPSNPPAGTATSVADKAKFTAWKGKRGLSQEEAMNLYISECDRQMRVYGTVTTMSGGAPTTPTNTPAADSSRDREDSVLLTPRGLAAIPLLCAAASETRAAYLARMKATSPNNGWWARQEPLCADPDGLLATPENVVIKIASMAESLALAVGNNPKYSIPGVPPSVLQAFLWPLHNVLLAVWIMLIFDCTLIGTSVLVARTILFGSKTTHVPLESAFAEEVCPAAKAANSLCEPHQAITVRLVGLALMPLVTICDVSNAVFRTAGKLAGSTVYVGAVLLSWWYWLIVFPWFAIVLMLVALASGWCFALIELAGA